MMKLRIIALLLLVCLCSCTGVSDKDIVGHYGIDKSVKASGEDSHKQLSLTAGHTFELTGYNTISGQWEVVESGYSIGASGRKEPQATIRFTYPGHTITGELRGNIFYFERPNVFNPDYKSVLFVRLNTAP